jgi:hypothetical protein
MTLRILTIAAILALNSACTIQLPLSDNKFQLWSSHSDDTASSSRDEAAGEDRQLGNPNAVPQ